jgi:outer membrane protein OmpA-like peptidoglycan-associated protein
MKLPFSKSVLTVGITALFFTGCTGQPGLVQDNNYNRTKMGALTGAIAGAMTGYNTKGSHKGRRAAIGAVIGAVAGSAIGYSLDQQANEIARALGTGVTNDPLAVLDPNRNIIVSKTNHYVKIMFRDRMMFASGSHVLQPSARNKVGTVANLLQRYPQTIVGVAGFTDNQGGYSYNLNLSRNRANAVANILAVNGYPKTKGCAYNKAIAPNNTPTNRALNRRVEVYLFGDRSYMTNPCVE